MAFSADNILFPIFADFKMFSFGLALFSFNLLYFSMANELFNAEPKIVYMDGIHLWDNCRPQLKRSLSALTGLLISHPQYGSQPYNASRNCFLTIAVPVGYRIRLKALDFDVQGQWGDCNDQDSLHVLDHNHPLEPNELAAEELLSIADQSLDKMLNTFCGKLPSKDANNQKHLILAESSHNALSLWWHSVPLKEETTNRFLPMDTSTIQSTRDSAQGYRLLWSSFRNTSAGGQCLPKGINGSGEFKCASYRSKNTTECIPSSLGCNSYADCADASDMNPQLQLLHGCEHIPNDPLSLLTASGPKRLLLVAALVLLWLSICMGCCCCLIHNHRERLKKKRSAGREARKFLPNGHANRAQNAEHGQMLRHPLHPDFHSNSAQVPPPPLPPPNFSPPALPRNRPPPAPAGINNARHQQRQSASNSSQSSSSQPHQRQHSHQFTEFPNQQQHHHQRQPPRAPCPPPHLNLHNNSSGGGTTSTATASNSNSQPANTLRATNCEYFYVQNHQQQQPFQTATMQMHAVNERRTMPSTMLHNGGHVLI